jgi:hypothetical protein
VCLRPARVAHHRDLAFHGSSGTWQTWKVPVAFPTLGSPPSITSDANDPSMLSPTAPRLPTTT